MTTRNQRLISIALTASVGLILAAMSVEAIGFIRYSKHFPMTFGAIGALVAAGLVLRDLRNLVRAPKVPAGTHQADGGKFETGAFSGFVWIAAYLAAAPVVGFVAGTGLFVMLFLRVRAGASWIVAILYTLACLALVVTISFGLNLDWPPNLIMEFLLWAIDHQPR